jgi:hypothetical protein
VKPSRQLSREEQIDRLRGEIVSVRADAQMLYRHAWRGRDWKLAARMREVLGVLDETERAITS